MSTDGGGLHAALAEVDARVMAQLLSASADFQLTLDTDGVVRGVAIGADAALDVDPTRWVGRALADLALADSRPKIDALLGDALKGAAPRWRQINHPGDAEALPVSYAAMAGADGEIIALGRGLRAMAEMQRRLIATQTAMERDYTKLKQMEMRYRALFQSVREPAFLVEAGTRRIVEANEAAATLLQRPSVRLAGRGFVQNFDPGSAQDIESALAASLATGEAQTVTVSLEGRDGPLSMLLILLRQEGGFLHLVQLGVASGVVGGVERDCARMIAALPFGAVITDGAGTIVFANGAFADMAELSRITQAKGCALEDMLGRGDADLSVMLGVLREGNPVRAFASTIRGRFGSTIPVEITAVPDTESDEPRFGFLIRNIDHAPPVPSPAALTSPRSVEQLTELVGRVPLKDLVRQTTDVIERMCIEAALELTGDNRASTAEMLGLSRQSLYVKLRRFGMVDGGGDPPAGGGS